MESFNELWELVRTELQATMSEVVYNVGSGNLSCQFRRQQGVSCPASSNAKIVEQKFYDV